MGQPSRRGLWGILLVVGLVIVAFWITTARELGDEPPAIPGAWDDESGRKADFASYQNLCKGKDQMHQREYAQAIAFFDEVIKALPDSRYAWNARIQVALCHAHLGDIDRGLNEVSRILEECPFDSELTEACRIKARILSLASRTEEAVAILQEQVEQNTGRMPNLCSETLQEMAFVLDQAGHYGRERGVLAWIMLDHPGRESWAKLWAQRELKVLARQVRERQKSYIQQRPEHKQGKRVDELGGETVTWPRQSGPYLIQAPLTIPRNTVLRIEPGVLVEFGMEGAIRLEGTLDAAGSEAEPIRFAPLNEDPIVNWWGGITVSGQEAAARLAHCAVSGAEIAVRVEQGRADLTHSLIDRCHIAGVQAERGGTITLSQCEIRTGSRVGAQADPRGRLTLTDCTVADHKQYGVVLQEAADGTVLRNTTIERCGRWGVLVRGRCSPVIEDCTIRRSISDGVYAIQGAFPRILGTAISDNGGGGLHLEDRCQDILVRQCRITGNAGDGILAEVRCEGEIAESRVNGNAGAGIRLRLESPLAVRQNVISMNKGAGLDLEQAVPRLIQQNSLEQNNPNLRATGDQDIDASGNWWGTTDEQQIVRSILAGDNQTDSGKVRFRPYLDAPPPPVTGTNTAN